MIKFTQMQVKWQAAALILLVAGTPASALAGGYEPPTEGTLIPHQYIVVLREGVPSAAAIARELAAAQGGEVLRVFEHALKGFVIRVSDSGARAISRSRLVATLERDFRFSTPIFDCADGSQAAVSPAPAASPQRLTCVDPNPQNPAGVCVDNWGLDRIDQHDSPRDGLYHWVPSGLGVHIYLVDTGLNVSHNEFSGRIGASHNVISGQPVSSDCSWSHGSHTAGIAAGATYGVAKRATVHSVQVWDCVSGMTESGLVAAFDWIFQQHNPAVNGPAVVNFSINLTVPAPALNTAVRNLIVNRGILVVESAGNQKKDACGLILGVPEVLIAGGADEYDTPWERDPGDPNYAGWCGSGGDCGSNEGSCVTLFAPAAHIVSSWGGASPTPTSICRLSGTSMAAPHVTGAAALYLETHPTATPAQVKAALVATSTSSKLTQLATGSPNLLLYVGPAAGTLAATPLSLDFASTVVGATSPGATVDVANSGAGTLQITSVTLAGANPGDFLVGANTCTGATLAPGAACSVGVQFTPHVDGSRAAVLAFASNDPASPTTRVALTGVGAWLTLRVEKSGSGRGAVTLNPGAKICTDACQLSLGYGAAADLTAKADPGSVFSGWSGGACLGVDPCLLSVVADTMVTATFSPVAEADAGQVALPLDGGQEVPIGDGGRLAGSDAGPDPLNEVTGSCGCQATAALPSSLGLFAFLAVLKRRRTALRP